MSSSIAADLREPARVVLALLSYGLVDADDCARWAILQRGRLGQSAPSWIADLGATRDRKDSLRLLHECVTQVSEDTHFGCIWLQYELGYGDLEAVLKGVSELSIKHDSPLMLELMHGLREQYAALPERSAETYPARFEDVRSGAHALLSPFAERLRLRVPAPLSIAPSSNETEKRRTRESPVEIVDAAVRCECGGRLVEQNIGYIVRTCQRCGRSQRFTNNPPLAFDELALGEVYVVAEAPGRPATFLVKAVRQLCPGSRAAPVKVLLDAARANHEIVLGVFEQSRVDIWNRDCPIEELQFSVREATRGATSRRWEPKW